MGEYELQATVLEDRPLPGVAQRLAGLRDLDVDDAASQLRAGLEAEGLRPATERAGFDRLRRVIAGLRDEEQTVEELGAATVAIELLALHVPPGGRASASFGAERGAECRFSLSALGSGFGSGRKLTIAVTDTLPERTSCLRILQTADVRVRRCTPGDDRVRARIETQMIAFGVRQVKPWEICPYCTSEDPPDALDFVADATEGIDLRHGDDVVVREATYELRGSRGPDVGLRLPVPGAGAVAAGLHVEQEVTATGKLSYTFVPGKRFTPCRPADARAVVLPFWHAD